MTIVLHRKYVAFNLLRISRLYKRHSR